MYIVQRHQVALEGAPAWSFYPLEIEKCSAKYFGSANELPGGDLVLPTAILDVFKTEIPNLDKIVKLNHEVTKIIWDVNVDGVTVMVGHDKYLADFCISTLPSGVMNEFHQDLLPQTCQLIHFLPDQAPFCLQLPV